MSHNGRLTSLSHGGGCGCKIALGVLSDILKSSAVHNLPPELLAGSDNNEDAAVYQMNERQAIVASTDFLMPIVDDPYQFARIEATNAITDIDVMGAPTLCISTLRYADQCIAPRGDNIILSTLLVVGILPAAMKKEQLSEVR